MLEQSHTAEFLEDLTLTFQPIVELQAEGDLIHEFECLLRSKKRGVFPAELFASIIEQEESHQVFMDWLAQQLERLLTQHPTYYFSVNFDPQQLFFKSSKQFFHRMHPYAHRMMIEITENEIDFVNNLLEAKSLLHKKVKEIYDLGYFVGLDDVSCGQNTLDMILSNVENVTCLKFSLLPFDDVSWEIKLSFIRAWKKVADQFGKFFVVEGVETKEVSDMLFAEGVIYQQGYYWSFHADL